MHQIQATDEPTNTFFCGVKIQLSNLGQIVAAVLLFPVNQWYAESEVISARAAN